MQLEALGDPPCRPVVLAAGKTMGEQRDGAHRTVRPIEQRGELLALGVAKIEFFGRHGASYLSAPSPRARGEGRDEGALTNARSCGAQNSGEAPSPAALRADDLSPRGGERQIECLPTVSASPRQTQRRAALAGSPSIVRPWPGCAKRYPARAHEPVTDLS